MKGLAIYTVIWVSFAMLACFASLIQGMEVETNVFAIGFSVPVLVFSIQYLRKK